MSAWSSAATGKPQISYAERLRKAQGNSASSASPSAPAAAAKLSQLAHAGPSPNGQAKEAGSSSTPSASLESPKQSNSLLPSAASRPAAAISNGVPATVASAAAHDPVVTPAPAPKAAAPSTANVWEARRKAMAEKASDSTGSSPSSGHIVGASQSAATSSRATASKHTPSPSTPSVVEGAGKGRRMASAASSAAPVITSNKPQGQNGADSASQPAPGDSDAAATSKKAPSSTSNADDAGASPGTIAGAAPLTDNSWLDRIQMLNGGHNVPNFDAGPSPTSQATPGVTSEPSVSAVTAAPASNAEADSAVNADAAPAKGRRKSSASRGGGRGRKTSTPDGRHKNQTQAQEHQPPSLEDPALWPSPIAAASAPSSSSRPAASGSGRPADVESSASQNNAPATQEPAKALEDLNVELARPIDAAKATKKGGKQWIPIVPTITHTSPLPPREKRPSLSAGDKEAAPRRSSKSSGSNAGPSNRRASKSRGSVGEREVVTVNSDGGASKSKPRRTSAGAASAQNGPAKAEQGRQTRKTSGAGASTHTSSSSTPARPAHLPATPPKLVTPPSEWTLDPRAASFGAAGMPVMRLGAVERTPPPHTDGSFSPTRRQSTAPPDGDEQRSGAGGMSNRGSRGPSRGRGRGGHRGGAAGAFPGGPGEDALYATGPYPPLLYPDGSYAYAPYPAAGPAGSWSAGRGAGIPLMPGMPLPFPEFSAPTPAMSNGGPTHKLLTQIEFYFSHRNLEGDFFLRQCMDDQGWVAIERVASFKRVKSITEDLDLVCDTLLYSTVLHVDVAGSRVRKAFGWEQYVLAGAAKHVPSEGSIAATNAGLAAAAAVQPSPAHSHRSTSTSAAPGSSVIDRLHPSSGLAQSAGIDGASGGGHDGQSSSTQLTESNVSKSSTAFSSPPSSFGRAASQSGDDSRDAMSHLLDDYDDDDRDDDDDDDDQETLGVVAAEGLAGSPSVKAT